MNKGSFDPAFLQGIFGLVLTGLGLISRPKHWQSRNAEVDNEQQSN